MIVERYRRQREYPQPPPPSKNNTKRTTNRVPISDLPYNVRLTRPRDVFPVLPHRPAACRRAIACSLPLTARLNPPPTPSERPHPYTVRSIRRQFNTAHTLGHNCSSSPGEKTTLGDQWGTPWVRPLLGAPTHPSEEMVQKRALLTKRVCKKKSETNSGLASRQKGECYEVRHRRSGQRQV